VHLNIEVCSHRVQTVLPLRFCHNFLLTTLVTNQIAIMPAISTNWNTIQTLPASTAPIIQRGWITLLLLEPIAGQERRILPRCTLCNQSFAQIPASMHSRTSNWLGHIRTKHPEQAEELNQHQASSSIGSSSVPQPQITPFTLNQRIPTNQDIRDLVRDLVVSCNLPIRMVDSAACQKLIQATRAPGAINRAIIGQEITSAYENRQIEIMSTLSYHIEQGIRFTLCIDCWTSQSQHAFLGVSIHYINRDWQQESFLLALADLRRRHTGVYLCRTLNKVLAVYGISQSILAITKDNASNNQTLMDAFQTEYTRSANQSVYSIPCVDHILNLVCQDILKKLKASTSESEIQEVAAETYFQDNEEAESEARDLELGYRQPTKRRRVSHAQKNRRTKIAPENLNCWAKIRWITGKLRQQQHLIRCLQRYITRFTADGTKMIRPVLDVPTRWNSFYHMIRNFSQSRRAIEAVMRRYPRDFTNLQITDSDWLIIHDVRKILGSIAALSEFFEGSRSYPTLSSALPMIGRLFGILENCQGNAKARRRSAKRTPIYRRGPAAILLPSFLVVISLYLYRTSSPYLPTPHILITLCLER
jgi:hypothetical protein